MGYRVKEHHHHHHHGRRTMQDIATPMLVSVHNGATAHLAIPLWYQEIQKPVRARHHNVHWHHHVGWPSPNHPDHICQLAYEGRHYGHKCPIGHDHCHQTCAHYIDMTQIIPIHLLSDYEHYNATPRVTFETMPSGLTVRSWVDEYEDWVVRVSFEPRIQAAISEPQDYKFTVFVDAPQYTTSKIDAKTKQTKTRTWPARTDVVTHGILRILPSSYQ